MPLFSFRCSACNQAFEALVSSSHSDPLPCRRCDAPSERSPVAAFRIGGRRPLTSRAALQGTAGEFVGNPDRYASALETFGESIGDRLTDRQLDRAVEQIKTLKR